MGLLPSIRLYLLLIAVSLLLTSCSRNYNPVPLAEADTALPPATMVIINTRQATPLPKGFFGLNVDTAASVLNWENPRAIEAIQALHPATLTYPGASAANCWDWLSGMARKEWIDQLGGAASSSTLGLRSFAQGAASFAVLKGGAPLQQFLNGCRSLGAQPLCCANVLHQKPEDTVQWLIATRALGVPVLDWELGSDLWRREYRSAYPSATEYIQQARAHADALRREEGSVKVAVCIPAEAFAEMGDKNASGKERKRNSQAKADLRPDVLARQSAIEQEKAYLRSWLGELALQPFYNAVSLDLNYALRADSKASPEMMLYAISRQTRQRLSDLVNLQEEWFGDKPIWVADWGISVGNTPAFEGSLLHGLSLAEMALGLANQVPKVERICYTDAGSQLGLINEGKIRQKVREDFQKTGKIVDATSLPLRFGELPASGRILQMLGEIFAQSSQLAALQVYRPPLLRNNEIATSSPVEDPPAALNVAAFVGKDGALRVVAINRSSESQAIRLVIDSQKMGGTVAVRSVHGSSLMPSPQKNDDETKEDDKGAMLTTKEFPATQIQLPPYSFSVVESWIAGK